MAVFSRMARPLRTIQRCVRGISTRMDLNPHQLTRYIVLTLGIFTPLYLYGMERYMRRSNYQVSDSHLPLPPVLGNDEGEAIIEAEMREQMETLQAEMIAQVSAGAMDDITMNHISDLISYYSFRKNYPQAIALAEKLVASSAQPRVKKELQGTLALLHFENALRQTPAEAKKSLRQCRMLAERTLEDKAIGKDGKGMVAALLFTMALWDKNFTEARKFLPYLPADSQEQRTEQLRIAESEPMFDEALKKNPTNVTALMQKGWALLFTGQHDAATEVLTNALRMAPPPTQLLQAMALNVFFSPADPFYVGVYSRCVGYRLEQAIAAVPTCAAINLLCSLHSRVGTDPEQLLQQFQTLFPDLSASEVCRILGVGCATLQHHPVATEITFSNQQLGEFFLQNGFAGADGYNAAYYYWLARLYHGVGNLTAEVACIKRGLDISPKCPNLRLQHQQLQLQYSRLVDLLMRRGRQQ